MKFSVFYFFVFLSGLAQAERIRVGIFTARPEPEYIFIVAAGRYDLIGDGKKIISLDSSRHATFQKAGRSVVVRAGKRVYGHWQKVTCEAVSPDGFFRMRATNGNQQALPFSDDLEVISSPGKLVVINVVDLEKYVCSVAESEAGNNTNVEFLKVQAIICRTFALVHRDRHAGEGFDVCDNVHCQVFKCKSRFNDSIVKAVRETRNLVLADSRHRLILAPFHSNCGGQTLGASDVWSKDLDYLVPVTDTFCLHAPHSTWEKCISRTAWNRFLLREGVPKNDSLLGNSFRFVQATRKTQLAYGNQKSISLKKIREEFKLKSTWFNIEPDGDSLLLSGFGYGHCVGLCQEGAMNMAALGYHMDDIIHHYYRDVVLLDYDAVAKK